MRLKFKVNAIFMAALSLFVGSLVAPCYGLKKLLITKKRLPMATPSSDFKSGEMPIEGQAKTYGGFLKGTIWGGGVIILICLYAILTFAANFPWLPALVGTTVVGFLYGLALKMKTGWFAMVIGLAIFGAIISLMIVLLN